MKKVIILFAFLFLLTACGSESIDANKTKKDSFGGLSFEVPESFSKKNMEEIENTSLIFSGYYYYFEKKGSNGKFDDMCSLSFFYDDKNNDYSLERFAKIFQEDKTGTKKTINGIEWLIFKEEINEKMVDYIYYAKNNNRFYEVSYSDYGSGSLCGDALEIIEKSLKFE